MKQNNSKIFRIQYSIYKQNLLNIGYPDVNYHHCLLVNMFCKLPKFWAKAWKMKEKSTARLEKRSLNFWILNDHSVLTLRKARNVEKKSHVHELDIKSFQIFESSFQTFVSSMLWSSTARGCIHVSSTMKGATQTRQRKAWHPLARGQCWPWNLTL